MKVLTLAVAVLLALDPLVLSADRYLQSELRQSLRTILTTPHDKLDVSKLIPDELQKVIPKLRHLNMKSRLKLPINEKSVICTSCIVAMEALADLIYIGAGIDKIEK